MARMELSCDMLLLQSNCCPTVMKGITCGRNEYKGV